MRIQNHNSLNLNRHSSSCAENIGLRTSGQQSSSIAGFLCRVLTPETVLLALHDRAQQMTVTHEDRLTVTGYKFYCTVRANHFVNLGTWYYEAKERKDN